MMEAISSAFRIAEEKFFSESFWLPEKYSWKDYELDPNDGMYIAQPRHLVYVVPCAIAIFFTRQLFER